MNYKKEIVKMNMQQLDTSFNYVSKTKMWFDVNNLLKYFSNEYFKDFFL